MKTYNVLIAFDFQGKNHAVGSAIELTDAQAVELNKNAAQVVLK